jgi:hypothetical protein
MYTNSIALFQIALVSEKIIVILVLIEYYHKFQNECLYLISGKRPDTILKMLQMVFDEASWRQPSVILLDDLEHVMPAPSGPEAEMSGEAVYGSRVAEGTVKLVHEITSIKQSSVFKGHPSLVPS